MPTKALIGASAVLLLGLLASLWFLKLAREDIGRLKAEVDSTVEVNHRQRDAISFLRRDNERLVEEARLARIARERAAQEVLNIRAEREQAIEEFERRLAAAKLELSDDELVCAEQPVPPIFIDQLLNN